MTHAQNTHALKPGKHTRRRYVHHVPVYHARDEKKLKKIYTPCIFILKEILLEIRLKV